MHDIGETAPWRRPEPKAVDKMKLDKNTIGGQGPRIRDRTIFHLHLGCISKSPYSPHSQNSLSVLVIETEGPKLSS
jgi:hypothetical protein